MTPFELPGYNEADRQFHEKDLQLIAKIREGLDAYRSKTEAEKAKAAHWMKCPKCGGQMKEIKRGEVVADQCTSCGGLFFDAGEFAMMVSHHKPTVALLDDIFSWLPRWHVNRSYFVK